MQETVIALKGIEKSYGSHRVLGGVNMEIRRGDIYGLVGRNGAGKTTLFKVILGLSAYQGGELSLFGGTGRTQNAAARKRIGFFVGANFFDYLSGRENLEYYRRLKGVRDKRDVERVLQIVGLDDRAASAKVRGYSLGMKHRLGMANALLGNPELLILDEPSNGLDPQGIADIRNLLIGINRELGTTILVSSHILGELEHTAFRFGIINDGVVVCELDRRDLEMQSGFSSIEIADQDVQAAQRLLSSNGIRIRNIQKASYSLEDVYFGMIGGEQHA